MAYFRQRGNSWSFTVDAGIDPVTGKRKQAVRSGFKSEQEARKACEKFERDLEEGKKVHLTTVEEFITKYYETVVINKVSQSTYTTQWTIAEKYIIPRLGRYKIDKVTIEQLDIFYNQLLREGVSRGYIKNVALVLSKTFRQAAVWGYVTKNVVRDASIPSYKPKVIDIWTPEQLETFLDQSRSFPNHALYVTAANSGARLGELLGLHWEDVDVFKCTMSITKSLKYTVQKGLHLNTTKTDNSIRTIILPQSTIDALMMHKETQLPGTSIVFDRFGEYQYPSCIWRNFKEDTAKVGLPIMKFHGLRHTHATILLARGYNAKVVAERLGDTVETVMKTYAHVLPNMQQDVANSLGDLYNAKPDSNVIPMRKTKTRKA